MKIREILEGDRWGEQSKRWHGMKGITQGNEVFRRGGGYEEILRDMEKRDQEVYTKMSPQDRANAHADDQAFVDWLYQQGYIGGNTMADLQDLSTADATDLYRQFNRRGSVRSRYAQGSP